MVNAPANFNRIIIENVTPEIDDGRYAVKRRIGDTVTFRAAIFMDGHDKLKASLCYKKPIDKNWQESPLIHMGNDDWQASLYLTENGNYAYTIKAWPDLFGAWQENTLKKKEAGEDIALDLKEGYALLQSILSTSKSPRKNNKKELLPQNIIQNESSLLGKEISELIEKNALRLGEVTYKNELNIWVDRKRAEFSAWYEIFPRSQGKDASKSGTFTDCVARLPDIAAMGFNVIYLTPIHPIGKMHRKGKNNALIAGDADPGSPYAIGLGKDGHKSIHPELGTLADFKKFVKAAKTYKMEIALDFAIQVSRDHPYLAEHPEWFSYRPDGSIHYAENPPKKYEDIVNVHFEKGGAPLWEELLSIIMFWVEQGVTIFRVDNPHTKPFAFWKWMIESVHQTHPDIIFLSEAFTRPKIMYLLAKAGFTQSYSYFTWRNTKQELTEYLSELTTTSVVEYYRPNFFPVTPDILPEYIQKSGRPGFIIRLTLAATLGSNYGMYNGYELCEAEALPGKEEYANSEKYEFKPRNWQQEGNIIDVVTRLNHIRNENPALQQFKKLQFCTADNDQILFYAKYSTDKKNIIFVAVNLDYAKAQEAHITLPLAQFGINPHTPYTLDNLLLGHSWQWVGERQHLRLDPYENPVAIFRIQL